MLVYCKALKFEEDPNYDLLYGLLMNAVTSEWNFHYEWLTSKPSKEIVKKIMGDHSNEKDM